MVKNRIVQIVFRTVYVTLGLIGVIGSLGYFNAAFNTDFYVYYTNLSNYICLGVMIASLVSSIKAANKKQDGCCEVAPRFKFLCVIMILVTGLVYNFLLAGDGYLLSISSLILHLFLPIMFVVDWVLFTEHGKLRWFDPLLCTVMPLIYVVFVLIRAQIVGGIEGALVYPYFFLNVDNLGWGGFFMWVAILVVIFVAIGYIFYACDHYKGIKAYFQNKKGSVESSKIQAQQSSADDKAEDKKPNKES